MPEIEERLLHTHRILFTPTCQKAIHDSSLRARSWQAVFGRPDFHGAAVRGARGRAHRPGGNQWGGEDDAVKADGEAGSGRLWAPAHAPGDTGEPAAAGAGFWAGTDADGSGAVGAGVVAGLATRAGRGGTGDRRGGGRATTWNDRPGGTRRSRTSSSIRTRFRSSTGSRKSCRGWASSRRISRERRRRFRAGSSRA